MDKDLAEYRKNLDGLESDEVDSYVSERSVIRPVAEAETRRELMELYEEKYKELTFQKAVEVVDEKLAGNQPKQQTVKMHEMQEEKVSNTWKGR